MTAHIFSRIARFGREMTVTDETGETVSCRGFIQPADTMDFDGIALFQAPGMESGVKYLFLAPPEAVAAGQRAETVFCGGDTYEVLGLQGIFCGETMTHWEGVLRKKGGAA